MAQTWSVFREFAQRSFCSSFFTALLPWVSFGSLRVSIPSADSRSELCGTDTHCLRCVGCNRDFFSPVFRIGFEAPIHPPLVACPVLQYHNSQVAEWESWQMPLLHRQPCTVSTTHGSSRCNTSTVVVCPVFVFNGCWFSFSGKSHWSSLSRSAGFLCSSIMTELNF